jgi:hypothetical protein
LALVITALVAVMGFGRPVAAASSGAAQITSIAAPASPGALRGGPDHRAQTPEGDARDGAVDALPPTRSFDIPTARSFAIASPTSVAVVRPAQAHLFAALPRGPPSFA